MNKRYIFLALFGLIVLSVVIAIVSGCLDSSRHSSMLPPSGIEKIDVRRMDGGTFSEEGRGAFLRAAVDRMILRAGGIFDGGAKGPE